LNKTGMTRTHQPGKQNDQPKGSSNNDRAIPGNTSIAENPPPTVYKIVKTPDTKLHLSYFDIRLNK
jgi:hypothetical protein